MPVNGSLWKQSISTWFAPPWPCPTCPNGRLRLVREGLTYKETSESRSSDEGDPLDVSYAFTAWLECDHCHEKISCCGVGGIEPVPSHDEEGNPELDYEKYFLPRFFSKPMMIFPLPPRCPQPIREEATRSFAVFFCDLAAAANHVRQCVELILGHNGIADRDPDGKFVSLAKRIEQFGTSAPENAERASALRWIGNFGSHPEALRCDDLFNAYEILEVLLEDLFVGHQRSVRELVERINENRGPRR